MTHILWDESFSVDSELLDGQHQLLFKIINRFYDAWERHEGADTLSRLFHEVLDYTHMHFTIEEVLMKQGGYPGLEAHKLAHKRLVEQAKELYDDIRRDMPDAGNHAVAFLKDWLEKHIRGIDKQYAPFIGDMARMQAEMRAKAS